MGLGKDANTLGGQIRLFYASPEFQGVSKSQQTSYRTWLTRVDEHFGKTTLRMWTSREMRGHVLDWRNKSADMPRSADEGVRAISRLMNWIVDYGWLPTNVLSGIDKLYENDRSDLIWEDPHFAIFRPHASVEVLEAVDLAASTGMRRGDLVKLPWDAIYPDAIIWRTGRSKGRAVITVPLIPEIREVLARIKARHAAEMDARPPEKRKPLPKTVLANSRWVPWTATGFGSRFHDAKVASGLDRNFHDLRGTFITRLILAGLTDDEIAKIVGWTTEEISVIRVKYCGDSRVVIALAERIAANARAAS
nr:tyrosine-type recombinase/integrase [uncultured Sphingomonas sp.]